MMHAYCSVTMRYSKFTLTDSYIFANDMRLETDRYMYAGNTSRMYDICIVTIMFSIDFIQYYGHLSAYI